MDSVKRQVRILFVEDLESDYELAVRVLKKENLNFISTRIETAEEMLSAFSTFNPDIIISDYSMPLFDGMKALQLTLKHRYNTPFIILTGSMNEETAVKCMKAGATDYVIKERIKRLPFAVNEAFDRANLLAAAKKAEHELVKSEERFRKLAENAQDLIYRYEFSPKRKFTYVSPSAKKITGYTPQDHYDDPDLASKLIHPDDKHLLDSIGTDFEQSTLPIELRWKRKDGKQIWIEQRNSLVFNNKGELIAIEGFARDITERKLTEEALAQSEKKYRNLVENSLVGVYTTNLGGEILFANKAFANIMELISPKDLINKDIRSFYKNKIDRDRFIETLHVKERIVNYEIEMVTAKGNQRNVMVSAIKSGTNISGMILDISDRKQAELDLLAQRFEIETQNEEYRLLNEELLAAKQKAEESTKLKTAFLQNLSHEIRTPMNGIVGFTQLLKEGRGNLDSNRQYLEMIERSGDRLMNMINDLVEISKIETGHISINISEFKVNPVLQELLLFYKKFSHEKGIEFTIGNIEVGEEVMISSDKGKFFQIFSNLINNAIKFTNQGRIEFGYQIVENYIEFYVKDTGIGIKPECISVIFERFRQVETSISSGYEGAGLGLSISKAFVEKLSGKIWVESVWEDDSSKTSGSTFKFTLPYSEQSKLFIKHKDMDKSTNAPRENQKVLVVEDDVVSRILLNEILKDLKMQITYARNGQEAIEAMESEPDFDFILMDIKMPIMNGYEATRRIREMGFAKPIIAQTAYAGDDDREKVMATGFNAFITKPVKKEVLLEILKQIEESSQI